MVWFGDDSDAFSVLDFKYYDAAQQFSYTIRRNGQTQVVLLDQQFTILDTLSAINGNFDVHDVQRAANGNWLFTTEYYDTVDLSAHYFGPQQGSATTALLGFGWQEVDQNGNLVFEWNSNDHIDPLNFYNFYGYSPSPFDYCHGNAIEEDTDGHLLLSFRHLNAVYKVNRVTGEIIWQLGGQTSDFTFTNDDGFSGQHDIRVLPNGNYSLFDNANMAPPPRVSRGVEYNLDTVNWTATLVNEVIHPDAFFARAMGNYQQLTDGKHLLNYGFVLRPRPTATLFDHNEQALAQFFFADSVVSYRCHIVQGVTIDQPGVSCQQNGNFLELIATEPHASYLWSTGATTASIVVTSPGDYQLWVPASSGFIGSEVIHLTDLQEPCGIATIGELELLPYGEYRLYDLLGRSVRYPETGVCYVRVYSNGHTEKHFLLTEP